MSKEQRAAALAEKIGIPTNEWKGNCHAIASAALESGFTTGSLCYGMYTGTVAPGSYFDGQSVRGYHRHGWVEREDGSIFDPTRWVFEGVEPYIYESRFAADYDYGMEKFRMMMQKANPIPCPEFNPEEPAYDFPENSNLAMFVKAICGISMSSVRASKGQVFWLANRVPRQLGSNAAQVFEWIAGLGLAVYIPIDFQNRYLTDDGKAKEVAV